MTWEAKFVGRESELKQMILGLEEARQGRGRILFFVGEAGVGKTRLAEELANQELPFEFEFLIGRCIYREGADPYLPFIDMFKGYLSTHPYLATKVLSSFNSPDNIIFDIPPSDTGRYTSETGTETQGEQIKEAKEVGAKTTEIHDLQLLEGKHRMFEKLSKLIIDISKTKPLVMFLDDLQWADAASLHLLHYLARNIKNQPIFILGAYRPEELDYTKGCVQPLHELTTRLGIENLFSTIEIDRLGHKHCTQIVSDLLGVKNIPVDFAILIYNETEGNPFFIKEVLRTLIEDGALSIKKEKLVLNIAPEEIVIPTSIRELIKLRVQRLDEDLVEVLEYASIIGNEFNLELLSNIIDIQESKLINILSKLSEAKFIEDVKEGQRFSWKFTHNKTREVIYLELNENKKKLIHSQLAKYLEDAKIDNIDEVVYDLAYHFYHGFDFDRALSYSIEGGEKAIKSYANREALDLYNISLNSLRRLDEKLASTTHYREKKIEVLSKLGMLTKNMGDWDKALDYYDQIIPICEDIEALKKESRIYLEMGWIYQQRGYWQEAQNYFRKGLKLAEVNKDNIIVTEGYYGLGAVFEREGKFQNAIEFYTTSRKFAEQNGDLLNLAKAHNAFGRIYNQQQNFLKAVKHKEISISLLEKIKELPELAKAYTSLALTYYDMGELDKNILYNEKCIDLADKISDIRIKGYGLSNAVESLVKTQQLDKALDYSAKALEIFKKLEERFMIALNYMNFGIIFKDQKDWDKSKYYFKTAIEFMENLKIPYHLGDCYRQFADMYKAKGESAKYTYYLEKAKEIYKTISADNYVKQIEKEFEKLRTNRIC
jgi:predicted ATPase